MRRLLWWLTAALVLVQSPAMALDPPGAPNRPEARPCAPDPMKKPTVCFTFFNTAGGDEVHFQIQMNDMPLDRQRQQCDKSLQNTVPAVNCAANDASVISNVRLGISVPDLEFDTRYCFRARTQRVRDQVVSALWTEDVCAQTQKKPPPPAPYPYEMKVDASASEIRIHLLVTNPDKWNLWISIADGYPVRSGSLTTGGSDADFYYVYKLQRNEDRIPMELCGENISGKTCAPFVVSAKQGKILNQVAGFPPATGTNQNAGRVEAVPPPSPPAPLIKHTDRSQPVAAGPAAFVGVWDTHTAQNGHFRVTFSESNGVLVGKFEDLNGNVQYNGTLTQKPGTEVKDGNLLYTYVQPATKGSGSGEFMATNPTTMVGQIVTNDNPPLKVAWWGSKVQ